MKVNTCAVFCLACMHVSCGSPARIMLASRIAGNNNASPAQTNGTPAPQNHVSPCGSFINEPTTDAPIDLLFPLKEQKISIGIDGYALLPVTVYTREKLSCFEFLTTQDGAASKGEWVKLQIEDFPPFSVAKPVLKLAALGINRVSLRAWTNGVPRGVVQLARIEVVGTSGGDEPTPTPTPTSTPTPTPTPTSTPTPIPTATPTPTPTPNPDAHWSYSYFEGAFSSYPDFDALTPVSTGATSNFLMAEKGARTDNFAFVYKGESWVNGNPNVSGTQPFTFFLKCDEGCKLFVNNFLVVDNRTSRGLEKSGTMNLSHRSIMSVRVEYFDSSGAENLEVSWQGPTFAKTPLTSDFLP